MTGSSSKMRTVNLASLLISVFILSLAAVGNGTTHLNITEKQIFSSKTAQTEKHASRVLNETDIKKKQESGQRKLTDKHHGYKHSHGRRSEKKHAPVLRDHIRPKRSVFSDHGYGFRIAKGSTMENRMKRLYSDYGYGSRLQAGENMANSYERQGLFGIAGPGKRSDEMTNFEILNEDTIKDKRINTDYGYGSRLQAAENVAMDWDRNGLFGVMGPGKRSESDYIPNLVTAKRIASDFGYGSRAQAAENAAISLSHGGLYGLYGPGKRNSELIVLKAVPENDISKRLTSDYGYGSRMQAAENVAQSASHGGLFGVHGPGKRSITRTDYMESGLPELEYLRKRFSSDFGYGSREQAAENLAKSSAKGKVFGVYGPGKRFSSDFGYGSREQVAENLAKSLAKGKVFGVYGPGKRSEQDRNIRSGEIEADSGYGSRIQAGSQIAKDIVAMDNLFGLLGPGRRKRM